MLFLHSAHVMCNYSFFNIKKYSIIEKEIKDRYPAIYGLTTYLTTDVLYLKKTLLAQIIIIYVYTF
jgi:hypothetical protein